MATLPPATTISSSHLDEALSRLPFFSGEGLSLRNLQKQRLPFSHSKQNAPFSVCERASPWKISAMAASAPQMKLPFGEVTEDEAAAAAAAEDNWFDWSFQWYPVSTIDDLDRRVPTAITVMGRHLVVSWDRTRQAWLVWDDKGREMSAPLSDVQINGKRGSHSSPSNGSLKSSSQNAHASVYPSVEKDGLLWFWPDTKPEFKNIAARKPPPSIPALTDPAFKDKLHSMNLPYGYKKMIENLLEPGYLPFAHDEPQEDFLEDFEKRLTRTAGHPSSRHSPAHAYKAKQKPIFSNTNGRAHEAENPGFKNTKAVRNGSANSKMELSYAAVQNGAPSKTNGSENVSMQLQYAEVQNGAPRSSPNFLGKTNGSVSANVEVLHEAKQSGALDSSTSIPSKTDGSINYAENHTFNITEAGEGGSASLVPSTKGGLQSREVWSQNLLGDSGKEAALNMDSLGLSSRSSTSRGEANASKVQSSVVLKKPATLLRTTFEEKVSGPTDPLNIPSVSSGEGVIDNSTSVSTLDLTSSLRTLRRMIFRKDFEPAKARVKELYQKYPGDTDILMEYAFVEKQLGDLVAAGSLYSQAIFAFEDQQNLGYDYVRALQALGSIEARARNAKRARVLFMESIRAARQAEQLLPDLIGGASVYGLHAWARLEEQQGNWAKARELLARAAEIQPGNAVVHQSRALLEARAHNWGAARYHFSVAVESAPGDVKCWHAWAIFEASQGKHKKMRDLFQKALEVDPYSVHCLQAWAHQETLIGTLESKDKARSLFQRCTQIEPKNLFAWQAWAVLEKSSENYDKARELFETCLEINSSSIACLQAYANMERHLKNWGAAQRLLRKALKLEPENAAVLMEAAFVENSLGNSEVAERLFVLAGMADKRKSRITNRIFASRKEVMPNKAGKGWRSIGKRDHKPSTNVKEAAVDAIDTKRLVFDSNSITEMQLNSIKAVVNPIKINGEESNSNFSIERQSTPIRAAVDTIKIKQEESISNLSIEKQSTPIRATADAIKIKREEFISNSVTGGQSLSHLKQEHRNHQANFQVVTDASKHKQGELKKNPDVERQPSFHLKQKDGNLSTVKAAIEVERQPSFHLKKKNGKFTTLKAAIEVERQSSFHLKRKDVKSNDLQAAIDAIKARQDFQSHRKASIQLKQGGKKAGPIFQAAIEAIDAKLRDLNSDSDMEEQLPFPLTRAERAPSMLGA